ncbi:hypothetical protein ACE15W_07030 [Bifidobacterium catenulatum subsp. kashiwanohense]
MIGGDGINDESNKTSPVPSLGMNPKQLYEYRELADELTRMAKEELA